MKKINKSKPKFFRNFINTNKPANWDGINEIRSNLRKHILETEQSFQCAYCESAITSNTTKSHIDHFKRKHYFPELTFDYNNLLVSCKNSNHCASKKDSKDNSKDIYKNLINPVDEDPTDFFEYHTSGKLISKNAKAEFTDKIFNLNHKGLKQQRKDVAWAVYGYRDTMELEEVIKEIGAFESFIRAIW